MYSRHERHCEAWRCPYACRNVGKTCKQDLPMRAESLHSRCTRPPPWSSTPRPVWGTSCARRPEVSNSGAECPHRRPRLQSVIDHVNAAGFPIADGVAVLHHVPQPLWDNISSRVHAQCNPRVQEDQVKFHVEEALLKGSCHGDGRAHSEADTRVDGSVAAGLGGPDQGNTITPDMRFAVRKTKGEASNGIQSVLGGWCPHFPLIFLRP